MSLPDADLLATVAQLVGSIERVEAIGVSTAYATRLVLRSGKRCVLKHHLELAAESFQLEARQLVALADMNVVPVIRVMGSGPGWLLLEEASPYPTDEKAWQKFGERIARLHDIRGESFGWSHDCYWGRNKWPACSMSDGHEFMARERFLLTANLPVARAALGEANHRRVIVLAGRLRERFPAQPPCLVHGDLWLSNVLGNAAGDCVLIDPSLHFGWPEWDLAMSTMWSAGFPEAFWQAYLHHHPLETGWRERIELLTIVPHLAHAAEGSMKAIEKVKSLLDRFE